jgi:hypothetical protein
LITNPTASSQHLELWAGTASGSRITSVGCHCTGTCATAATWTFEDQSANAIALQGVGSLACQTGTTAMTFTLIDTSDTDRDLLSGEQLRTNVANVPTSLTDTVMMCVRFTLL